MGDAQVGREQVRVGLSTVGNAQVGREQVRAAVTTVGNVQVGREQLRVAISGGTILTGFTVPVWSGSEWVDGYVRGRGASSWIDAVAVRAWTGSAWYPPLATVTQMTPVSATASSTYSTNTTDKTYDGSTTTYWWSNGSPPQWIYYDLGAAYQLDHVETYHASNDKPTAFRIEGSNNASTWTQVADHPTAATNGSWETLTISDATPYRYVRVYSYGSSGNWWQFYEVKIWAWA